MGTQHRFPLIAALATALLTSCAPLEAPTNDAEGASRFALEPLLRPGSVFLCPSLELHFQFWAFGDAITAEVSHAPQPDGSLLVHVMGKHTMTFNNESTSSAFACAGWVDVAGKAHPIELPPDKVNELAAQTLRLLPFSNGTLFYGWNPSVATALWWKNGATATVPLDIQSLSGVIGIRADKAGPVTMIDDPSAQQVRFQRWSIDATPKVVADGQPVTHPIPAATPIGTLRFVDEVAPGVFAWVQMSGTGLDYLRTDRPNAVSVPFTDNNIRSISRDPSSGHIVIVGQGVHDWDADGTGTIASPQLPPPSQGYTPWNLARSGTAISEKSEPNPNASSLRIPLGYQSAWLEGGALTVRETPSTPCSDRDQCRGVAEHYLIGALKSGTQRHGVYYSWPWLESFVRPLIVIAPLP